MKKQFRVVFLVKLSQLFLIVFLLSPESWSHGTEVHSQSDDEGWEVISQGPSKEQLNKINSHYLKSVKPIFKSKCLSCHGKAESLPWYAVIPGPKQLIESDIKEAKEHMDMTSDVPFSGHGTLKDDLEALSKSIDENKMPPWQYMLIHWQSGLEEKEKKIIKKWINESRIILEEKL